MAQQFTRVIGVYPGPVDTDMAANFDMPGAPTIEIVDAVLQAVIEGREDVFPDQMSADYCVAANSTFAGLMEVPDEVIQAIRKGQPLADEKLQTLRIFVTDMVQNHGVASPEAIKKFIDAGYSNAQLLEVIMGISLETFASFTALVANKPPELFLEPKRWLWRVPWG